MVPISVTLNHLQRRNGRYRVLFHRIWSFGANLLYVFMFIKSYISHACFIVFIFYIIASVNFSMLLRVSVLRLINTQYSITSKWLKMDP